MNGNGNGYCENGQVATTGLPNQPPPQNLEAERGVLGGLLLDNSHFPAVLERISDLDFYRDAHQVMFRAMADMHRRGDPVEIIGLVDELKARDQFKQIGGHEMLLEIASSVPHGANCVFHAGIVLEKSVARQMLQTATQMIREGYSGLFTSQQLFNRATSRFGEIRPIIQEPWPDLSLKEAPEAVPFPVDVFPEALRRFCLGVGRVTLTPPDMAGCAMLAVASAAIGQSCQVLIKRTWKESPLLYLLTVADPGRTKSPVIKLVGRPLTKIDSALRLQSSEALALYEAIKKAAPKGAEPEQPPPQRRAIVKDITRETLVAILRDNPRGVLVNPDEATAWVASFNEYKAKGSDKQFWLDVWASGPISVDREGGRRSLWVPAPLATVMGGLPPDMLTSLAEANGRNDGFFDRLLFCYPDKFPKQEWTEEELDQGDETTWSTIVGTLHAQEMFREPTGELRPNFVGFDHHAKGAYVTWYNSHCEESESLDMPPTHVGHWSKLRAYCLRLALILSRLRMAMDPEIGAELVKSPVALSDVQGAIALIAYFKSHFARVNHRMTGGTGSRDAWAVLSWIERKGLSEFRERDVRKDLVRRFPTSQDLHPALLALIEAGAIRPKPGPDEPGRKGRKPTPAYEVNPALKMRREIDRIDKTPF